MTAVAVPEVVHLRVTKPICVLGERVEVGQRIVLPFDLAMAAIASGKATAAGTDAGRVVVTEAWAWGAPRPEPASQQPPGAWMTPAADAAVADSPQPRVGDARGYAGVRPRRGLMGAMELALHRWAR